MKNKIFRNKSITLAVFLILIFVSSSFAQWSEDASSIWNTTLTKNVGIGVSSPQVKLQVRGDVIVGSHVPGQRFLFHTRDWIGGDAFHIAPDDNGGNWQFNKGVTLLRSSGNFGINITPVQKLDVNGKVNVREGVIQNGTTALSGTNDLGLYSQTSSGSMRFVTTTGDIKFYTDGNIGQSAQMTLTSFGGLALGLHTVSGYPGLGYFKMNIEQPGLYHGMGVKISNTQNGRASIYGLNMGTTTGIGLFGDGYTGLVAVTNNTSSGLAGIFYGNVKVNSLLITSDARFKKDIKPLQNGILEKLMSIEPKEYSFDNEKYPGGNFSEGRKTGFIAQELEKVFPELVNSSAHILDPTIKLSENTTFRTVTGYYSVDYVSMIPFLVKAIQEQQHQIASLSRGSISSAHSFSDLNTELTEIVALQSETISQLETRLNIVIEALSKNGINIDDKTDLKNNEQGKNNKQESFRSGSYPNPFNPKSTIRFTLPAETKVSLKVYDIAGKLINTLINNEYRSPGEHSVVFDGSTLSSGTYFYTIEAGTFSDTQKLILIK
jgi:hypothetical protein